MDAVYFSETLVSTNDFQRRYDPEEQHRQFDNFSFVKPEETITDGPLFGNLCLG
jgi:hypothetical protein